MHKIDRYVAEYFVKETTTHKTILDDGCVLRTDLQGFYAKEDADGVCRSSWFGCADLHGKMKEDFEWEEEEWSRSYTTEYDYS